jgi:hypothetical protein
MSGEDFEMNVKEEEDGYRTAVYPNLVRNEPLQKLFDELGEAWNDNDAAKMVHAVNTLMMKVDTLLAQNYN